MDPNLIIALASLLFTFIGSVAAVVALRQSGTPRSTTVFGAVDARPALRLLGRRISPSAEQLDTVRILARFVFVSHSGRVVVGALDQFEISLFLDLFSACTYPAYRRRIAKLLVRHINNTPFHERPSHIAVPKEGNVLLAAEVARQTRLSVVVVRTIVPTIRFGDPVEGMVSAGARVIVVDDIASDGELLVRTVASLRAHGTRVSDCFCAVERLDGNSRERLAKHDVTLHAPIKIDEPTLRELAHLRPEERHDNEPSPTEVADN